MYAIGIKPDRVLIEGGMPIAQETSNGWKKLSFSRFSRWRRHVEATARKMQLPVSDMKVLAQAKRTY